MSPKKMMERQCLFALLFIIKHDSPSNSLVSMMMIIYNEKKSLPEINPVKSDIIQDISNLHRQHTYFFRLTISGI